MAFDPLKSLDTYLSNNQFKMPSFKPTVVTPVFDPNAPQPSRVTEGPQNKPITSTVNTNVSTSSSQPNIDPNFNNLVNWMKQNQAPTATDTTSPITTN